MPTCIGLRGKTHKTFEEFVLSRARTESTTLFPIYSQCLVRTGNSISIGKGCIGCLHCVFGCPGRSGQISVEIDSVSDHYLSARIRVDDSCGSRTSSTDLKRYWNMLRPFSGLLIEMTGNGTQNLGYKFADFGSFLEREETKRIAIWVATVCSAIFGPNALVSRELPVKVYAKPRDGRVDVAVVDGADTYAIETKTSFDSAMVDNRFDIQISNYQVELDSISERLKRPKVQQLLVFGGDESKMLPATHPMCSSTLGGRSDEFYGRMAMLGAPLVSAHALLLFGLRSLFEPNTSSLLKNLVCDRSILAVLSAGAVKKVDDRYVLFPVPT